MNNSTETKPTVNVLHIPVISTKHLPNKPCLTPNPQGTIFAKVPECGGGFFSILSPVNLIHPEDDWLIPVKRWLDKNSETYSTWVLFDCDGDVIESLPIYR